MKTYTNIKGTKAVNISTDGTGTIRAMYVQIYDNQEQVLDSKSFASSKSAEKWALNTLNINQ